MSDTLTNPRHEIACLLVNRKYKKEGIALPSKFWNLPKYKKDYQHQIRLISKLGKIYDYEILLTVIKENDWMYSLAIKKLDELVEKAKDRILTQQAMKVKKQEVKNEERKPQVQINFRKKVKSNFKDSE